MCTDFNYKKIIVMILYYMDFNCLLMGLFAMILSRIFDINFNSL